MRRRVLFTLLMLGVAFPLAAQDVSNEPPFTILKRSKAGMPVIELVVAGERFALEIAATAARRELGMGNRARFPKGSGMLFVHPTASLRSYWMKNCLFDIDLAYLNDNGVIVAVHEMKAEPQRRPSESTLQYTNRLKKYLSAKPAQYALEFVPGTIQRLKLKPGQTIPLPRKALRGLTR